MLDYIPADSPFVLVSPEPLPRAITDWIGLGLASTLDALQSQIAEKRTGTTDRLNRAVMAELDGRLSRAGMESLGFTLEPRFAIYTIGLSLAVRVEVADGAKVAALLDRIEQNSGQALPMASLLGVTYRQFVKDDMAVVAAVIGNELVFGLMHQNARKQVLPVLFGKTRPARTLADTGVLRQYRDKYQLLGVGLGYIDVPAILAMVMGTASPLSQEIIKDSGLTLPPLSPACKSELNELAATVPRLVFGYQDLAPTLIRALVAIELRKDLADDLARQQAPVLDLQALANNQPLFAMGMNTDLGKLMAFARSKVAKLVAAPYRCEHFNSVNERMAELQEAMNKPWPPFLAGFKAFALSVNDIQMNGYPPNGSGYLAIAMDDAMAGFRALADAWPQLHQINLVPDGKPASVSLGVPGMNTLDVAATKNRLVFTFGAGMQERVSALLASKPGADTPAIMIAYDYARFMQLASFAVSMYGPDLAVMTALGNILGYMRAELRFSTNGILTTFTMEPRTTEPQQAR